MNDEELSPEQRHKIEDVMAELEAQMARVRVDLRAAMRDMNQIEPPQRSAVGDDGTFTESHTIDVSGILDTLRGLPDGAGTAAFVTAYNLSHTHWRHRV
jgi:hypothetical protein